MDRRLGFVVIGALMLLGAANLSRLWPIETEDAFVVHRYAANLVERGELVFNPGERVSALTSPLHTLSVAGLHRLFDDPVGANKTLGLMLFVTAVLALVVALRREFIAQVTVLTLVAISPFAALWAVGGLETPVLFALMSALALLLRTEMARARPRTGASSAAFVLGGLAFLTRYDAAIIAAPALAALALRLGARRTVLPAAIGAIAPLAWLVFAHSYFGDIFPTSFYLKTPTPAVAHLVYTFEFYLYSGLPFYYLLPLGMVWVLPDGRALWQEHWRRFGWAYASLGGLVGYGLVASATHMFYSFRLFVPFLAIAALACGDLVARIGAARSALQPGIVKAFAAVTCFVVALQGVSLFSITQPGGNVGGSRTSEFRIDGATEITAVVEDMRAPAGRIREHWSKQPASRARPMRLKTFAAGALPFALRDAYVYTPLVSYRHHCERSESELSLAADYITISGYDLNRQIRSGHFDHFKVLSNVAGKSYGQIINHVVLFNPRPMAHTLSGRIDEACPTL